MKTFNLKSYLTGRKEEVLEKFENLTKEDHYNGISLKEFMVQFMNNMAANNPKSIKRADSLFIDLLYSVYYSNCEVGVIRDLDAIKAAKAPNQQWMAII